MISRIAAGADKTHSGHLAGAGVPRGCWTASDYSGRGVGPMNIPKLRWDLALPQGANLEFTGVAPDEAWRAMLTAAAEAERLGYDTVWALDRTETLPRREPRPVFDAWTALAAISQHTDRIGLGQLGLGAPVRDAARLAKRAACLDVLSGGRMALALETDGYPSEQEA